ncbi:MAG TPA: peptide MFS transporter [Steroidobacteraceae bacterium]|nr:peptide MFS transporter [Steroidobacteraceae bacterium]
MNVSVSPGSSQEKQLFGHPRGLMTLFLTEMWERSTYYGARAILILFMTALIADGGLGIDDATASSIYGLYISATYLLSLWGGWVADRLIGQQRAVLAGGVLIMVGNAMLVVSDTRFFFVGLTIIVFGTGLLKPNISAMVAQLYPEGGARRDAGFSIFYMGINVGATLGQVLIPIIAVQAGWKIGFVVPAIGMLLGVVQFWFGRKYLSAAGAHRQGAPAGWWPVYALVILTLVIIVLAFTNVIKLNPSAISATANWAMIALATLYFLYLIFFAGLDPTERGRVFVMIALFIACAMFWMGYEQTGASLTLFADRYTNRNVFGWTVPAGAVQSFNSIYIIIFAPFFAALWVWLGKRNLNPSAPFKFALGLLLMGAGFAVMVAASHYVLQGQTVALGWLAITYMFHTWGELCLSPVGLSSMTKLAPARFVGQVMGVWFLATAIGNNLAGRFSSEIDPTHLETMPTIFSRLFWFGMVGGIALFAITPFAKRLIKGAD